MAGDWYWVVRNVNITYTLGALDVRFCGLPLRYYALSIIFMLNLKFYANDSGSTT